MADVTAAEANVQRLEQLTAFKNITAPFDGTVTARGLDVGSLVSVGSTKELFHLQQTQPLRVSIDLPQTQMRAVAISTGIKPPNLSREPSLTARRLVA